MRTETRGGTNALLAAPPPGGAAAVWFTGLSGSGKTTLALALAARLLQRGHPAMVLDGDRLRQSLCSDLGFSRADRRENIRRASHVAHLFLEQGIFVLCAFVSPFREDRERARQILGPARFVEIYVECTLEECGRRDPKGLYAAAAAGRLRDFTGVTQAYEPPLAPDFVARTHWGHWEQHAEELESLLRCRGLLPDPIR